MPRNPLERWQPQISTDYKRLGIANLIVEGLGMDINPRILLGDDDDTTESDNFSDVHTDGDEVYEVSMTATVSIAQNLPDTGVNEWPTPPPICEFADIFRDPVPVLSDRTTSYITNEGIDEYLLDTHHADETLQNANIFGELMPPITIFESMYRNPAPSPSEQPPTMDFLYRLPVIAKTVCVSPEPALQENPLPFDAIVDDDSSVNPMGKLADMLAGDRRDNIHFVSSWNVVKSIGTIAAAFITSVYVGGLIVVARTTHHLDMGAQAPNIFAITTFDAAVAYWVMGWNPRRNLHEDMPTHQNVQREIIG